MITLIKQIEILLIGIFCSAMVTSCHREINNPDGINKRLTEKIIPKKKQEIYSEDKPYANPVMMYGSSFGNYFQVLYRTGQFEKMVDFTSSESIEKYSRKRILGFYQNEFVFGYELGKLKSKYEDGDSIILNYPNAIINATKTTVRISVVVENDTCKILLPSLKPNPFQ